MLVCNLYFSLPFGQMHARNPCVVRMARALGRSPGSVAMKLVNFASLDEAHRARGVSGLTRVSSADKAMWADFHSNWPAFARDSEKLLQGRLAQSMPGGAGKGQDFLLRMPPIDKPTEAKANVRIRITQHFFRKVVLAAYDGRCCVTGNPVPDLLIASHILPWSEFPRERTNPHNGLCLAAHFDKAFDRGLMTFGEDGKLKLSPELQAYLPNEALEREFKSMEGASMRMPERFPPNPEFLRYHREFRFRR